MAIKSGAFFYSNGNKTVYVHSWNNIQWGIIVCSPRKNVLFFYNSVMETKWINNKLWFEHSWKHKQWGLKSNDLIEAKLHQHGE